MASTNRAELIRVKVKRAKQHLCELKSVRDQFMAGEPYAIEMYNDPKTGLDTFRIIQIKTPPIEIGIVVGDVIHNLRSALDHLAYQLVLANGGTPSSQTCFPIFEDAAKYAKNRAGKVKGMSQDAIDLIDDIRPYLGEQDVLWYLHAIDIADKHHALLPAVICPEQMSFETLGNLGQPGFRIPIITAKFGQPFVEGDIFFRCEPHTYRNTNFIFDVGLAEPEAPKTIAGKPLLQLLQYMINDVDNLITKFESLLT